MFGCGSLPKSQRRYCGRNRENLPSELVPLNVKAYRRRQIDRTKTIGRKAKKPPQPFQIKTCREKRTQRESPDCQNTIASR